MPITKTTINTTSTTHATIVTAGEPAPEPSGEPSGNLCTDCAGNLTAGLAGELTVDPLDGFARQPGASFARDAARESVRDSNCASNRESARASNRESNRESGRASNRPAWREAASARTPVPDDAFAVSVVLPVRGRLDLLDRSLDALTRQSLPGAAYELIIVDDEADPSTLQLVAGWRSRTGAHGPCITYLANDAPHGTAAARNRGWRLASAPIIAFTDDDTVPAADWLQQGLSGFTDQVDVLCGRVQMPLPRTPTDYQRDASQLESSEFNVANCFCRKSVLQAVDGFDERFSIAWRDDSDLYFRLLKSHARIGRAEQALVVHPVRPAAWGASLSQTSKISYDALLYKKHPELYREKIRRRWRWDYYAVVGALLAAAFGLGFDNQRLAVCGAAIWLMLTALFCMQRLRGTAKTPSHILEMVVTSALIPPLAVFWRVVGAIKFRARFA